MTKQNSQAFLAVKELTKYFGGLQATNQVTFDIFPQEVVSIIGPNGAGKTTLINLITGVFPPTGGTIWFNHRRIDRLPQAKVNHFGIARTFQDLRLFTNLSVVENVIVGARQTVKASLVEIMTRLGRSKRQESEALERSMEKLALVGLDKKAPLYPFNLSAKEQKLLAIARCLATEPTLLFLDEPAGGLSREEIRELSSFILTLREKGLTIVFIEHRMEMIMGISDRVIVLNFGQKIADDIPAKIQENEAVLAAYLPKMEKKA
jgi:ABC-type branched-subunit amino acid transport system ATPase component